MPDWLQESFEADSTAQASVLAVRLVIAFLLGLIVAAIYRFTHGKGTTRSTSMMATLVLLTILIGMVTLVIGNSVARAFSLVGALAIVRFRTVVEDTRDTAFVIFAVAVGMAAGAGFLAVPAIGIPLTAVAAFLFRPTHQSSHRDDLEGNLSVRLGIGHNAEAILPPIFAGHLDHWQLSSAATARQGTAMNLTYSVRFRTSESAIPLIAELNQIEGVQEIELKK